MDFFRQLEKGRYGSFELKHQVGPNLLKGLMVSLLVNGSVVASPFLVGLFHSAPKFVTATGYTGVTKIIPPLVLDPGTTKQRNYRKESPPAPKYVRPYVDPKDAGEPETPPVPDQNQWKEWYSGKADSFNDLPLGDSLVAINLPPDEQKIPDPTIYITREIEPVPVTDLCPQPDYPQIARVSGMEGKVQVLVYVDEGGNVKKWQIAKANPPGLGFEDEVGKVIPRWRFTPAIQSGRPVGVWVAVPFKFQLKK